jgi:3,8-divinyl chlorophyllide a/chlorophyllide a reductase subunit Y
MNHRVIPIQPASQAPAEGVSCSQGADQMRATAESAGKAEVLAQYDRDYPRDAQQGPHDQPQSMCPAFGSLRVGLRMRRVATILSGSACCVYGLTFTSHFYGARRSVGYVPFNSETLVTGKLFEDIREAVFAQADPDKVDAVVIINLCVPTASGVPLQLLPKDINGVRVIGIDVPGFGVPTHAEAKDVLTAAMLRYAKQEVMNGPVMSPKGGRQAQPTIALLGEMFPADPVGIAQLIAPMGLGVGAVVPMREWRELYAALDSVAVAAIHPFYTASVREFQDIGRPVIGSAPVGVEGVQSWLADLGQQLNLPSAKTDQARNSALQAMRQALQQGAIQGRITISGYEGSELIVARLLVECGADVRYVGSACPATAWNQADAQWLQAHGAQVQFRASLEQDLAAVQEYQPQLAIGTTPVVQQAKQMAIPSLYFTNLISARPLMGVAGIGSLVQVVRNAIGNQDRFKAMSSFFDHVGSGDTAGVWEGVPKLRPEFRAEVRRQAEKLAKKRKAEEMGP